MKQWKLGDVCFVTVGDRDLPATVSKVGRRWLAVSARGGRVYEFDMSKEHLPEKTPFYGCGARLLTTEDKVLRDARNSIYRHRETIEKLARLEDTSLIKTALPVLDHLRKVVEGEATSFNVSPILWELCSEFVRKNHISCPETVYQTDWVAENSLPFIEEVAKIVGFYEEQES